MSVIRIWTETNIYDKVMRGRKFCALKMRSTEILDAHGKKRFMEEKKHMNNLELAKIAKPVDLAA